MSKSRKSKSEDAPKGAPEWMNTYGDMVTLLLTFFVLLFAFSNIDKEKFDKLIETFTGYPPAAIIEPIDPTNPTQGFSPEDYIQGVQLSRESIDEEALEQMEAVAGNSTQDNEENKRIELIFSDLYEKLKAYIETKNLGEALILVKDGEYIFLTVIEGTLFDSGKADLKETAQVILEDIGSMLFETQESIESIMVEGHTDNIPIATVQFADNWDLSTKRATNVVRFISNTSNLPMPLFIAVGKGEWEPVQSNDTDEGRRQNRRVKFIVESKNIN